MSTPRLPIRERPLAGESLTGFLRRHVRAMHYQGLRQLLSLLDGLEFPSSLDCVLNGATLRSLATLLGRSEMDLRHMTVHRWTDSLVLRSSRAAAPSECDSKTLLRYFQTARPRVCPTCLAEHPEHDRLLWLFRPSAICLEHATVLLDRCPGCRKGFWSTRLDLVHCRCGHDLSTTPPISAGGRAVELTRRILDWLDGATLEAVGLPPHAGYWWLDRLRSTLVRTPTWLERVKSEWNVPPELDSESTSWLAAAALLVDGPTALAEFLEVYQTIEKHRSSTTGVGRSFGPLLRDAAHLEQLGYSVPARQLRDYLLEHYDRGHLTSKVILFRTARDRRHLAKRLWLDQTAAARELGVRTPTIRRLVERGALVGRIAEAGCKGRTSGVVSRESVEVLRKNLAATLSTAETGEQLGIERHRVLDLMNAGILREAIRSARGWRLTQGCVNRLLQQIAGLATWSPGRPDWISLREAARRFGVSGLNLAGIVERVLSGRLHARRDPNDDSLRGIYLDIGEVRRLSQEARTALEFGSGYPLNRLTRLLIPGRPLKETVLKKWIRAGLLHARRRRKAWQVAAAEIERFRATYCLAPEASALLNVSRNTLARWEAEERITPIYGRRTHPGAGASVFLRADVRRLAAQQAA